MSRITLIATFPSPNVPDDVQADMLGVSVFLCTLPQIDYFTGGGPLFEEQQLEFVYVVSANSWAVACARAEREIAAKWLSNSKTDYFLLGRNFCQYEP